MPMNSWIGGVAAACLVASGPALAAPDEPAPAGAPAGAHAIPLYGAANPGKLSDEIVTDGGNGVRNVTYPTLTPVLPKAGTANGSAVIVAPGGAFMFLSMDSEGWRIAQTLADRGVTAFVLKYRLVPTPKDDAAFRDGVMKLIMGVASKDTMSALQNLGAGQDALAALKLVRARSAEWGVDPARVGMIGFSAGAITTLKAVMEADRDGDPATTAPDFFGNIYGPMDSVEVPPNAPPMFAALAADDGLSGKNNLDIVTAWRKAGRPVELHLYQAGGHGFGSGRPGTTTTLLMPEFLAWLDMQGFLTPKPTP